MTPAPVLVVAATRAVMCGDWHLARHLAKEAVLARVSALLDDGHEVTLPALPATEGRMVGKERAG